MSYTSALEQQMKNFFDSLSEKDRRRYAAIEAAKLGHGGQEYIAQLFDIDPKTLRKGLDELPHLSADEPERIRRPGAGRKSCRELFPDLDAAFLDIVKNYTAGDPMRPELHWTNLTPKEIAHRLRQRGLRVSIRVVKELLDKHHYTRRKARKSQTMGQHRDRDAQFRNIDRLKQEFLESPHPLLSIDTKKKELVGNFYRDGYLYTQQVVTTFDHDFPSAADGKLCPHGIFDLKYNDAYLNVGTSHDTSAFACDSIAQWWYAVGRERYPQATMILILCDGGGSNCATHYVFKEALQQLADRLGLAIRIAHYPPYCSKYNPIEHRVFPHVTRACQGLIFTSVAVAVEAMGRATTRTGLQVVVNVMDKVYETGRKVAKGFKESMRIVFDAFLPKWNYTAVPNA